MEQQILKKLKLTRPLCGIDVETTGTDKVSDRVIELTVFKINPDNTTYTVTKRFNPEGKKSEQGAIDAHGISDEDLLKEEPFSRYAKNIYKLIYGCDFVMYNGLNFDISFLDEELLRCGFSIDWDYKLVDPYRIFSKEEPRTLKAAYKFYCNKESEHLHSAEEDVKVMLEVLDSQIERYGYEPTVDGVCHKKECIDLDNKIKFIINSDTDEVSYVWNFGKWKDCNILANPGYCAWFLCTPTYTRNTKSHLRRIMTEGGLDVDKLIEEQIRKTTK